MQGLINSSLITATTAPADGAAGATTFASKTNDQVIRDINNAMMGIATGTNWLYYADTILLPPAVLVGLAGRIIQYSSMTLLDWIKNYNVLTVQTGRPLTLAGVRGLETAGVGTISRMVAYRRDPQVLKMWIPMSHRFLPVWQRGPLVFDVPGIFRLGGVEIRMPAAMRYLDGVRCVPTSTDRRHWRHCIFAVECYASSKDIWTMTSSETHFLITNIASGNCRKQLTIYGLPRNASRLTASNGSIQTSNQQENLNMAKIKNTGYQPRGFIAADGSQVLVPPGGEADVNMTEADFKFLKKLVDDHDDPKPYEISGSHEAEAKKKEKKEDDEAHNPAQSTEPPTPAPTTVPVTPPPTEKSAAKKEEAPGRR